MDNCLPKNKNGVRTAHTCELCGYEPRTKNKYREKQDHLVMKHFKVKIDQLFPLTKPYACPTDGCLFVGKDRQALLRHFTGKHGILERYLNETLAENGIEYLPIASRARRQGSIPQTSDAKNLVKKVRPPAPPRRVPTKALVPPPAKAPAPAPAPVPLPLKPVALLDPKDLLPKEPLPMKPRQNTKQRRKEVEAIMATLKSAEMDQAPPPIIINVPIDLQSQLSLLQPDPQPQPQHQQLQVQSESETTTIQQQFTFIELPQQPLLPELCVSQGAIPEMPSGIIPLSQGPDLFSPYAAIPVMQQQQQQPLMSFLMEEEEDQPMTPALPMVPLPYELIAAEANLTANPQGQMIFLSAVTSPSMISTSAISPSTLFSTSSISPPALFSTSSITPTTMFSTSSITSPTMFTTSALIDNKEVMWGSGSEATAVAEDPDSMAITYIETIDGNYAAMQDALDCDLLMPSINSLDPIKERQLNLCTF